MFLCFCSDFLYKTIYCGYSFELHRQADAIQMGTHNICLYKEVDKKYTGYNRKNTELLVCALIRVCAVTKLKTVCIYVHVCMIDSQIVAALYAKELTI